MFHADKAKRSTVQKVKVQEALMVVMRPSAPPLEPDRAALEQNALVRADWNQLAEERAAGADAFQLFGMLARQIRLLLQARAILDLNPKAQKQDLADGLSIHPFVAQKLLTEVRSWSAEKLESLHGLAFKLDKSMKTGLDPDISVDRLVTSFLKVS